MTNKLRKQFEKILSKKRTDGLYEPDLTFDNWNEKMDDLLHAVDQQHQELREKIAGMKREIPAISSDNFKQNPTGL